MVHAVRVMGNARSLNCAVDSVLGWSPSLTGTCCRVESRGVAETTTLVNLQVRKVRTIRYNRLANIPLHTIRYHGFEHPPVLGGSTKAVIRLSQGITSQAHS